MLADLQGGGQRRHDGGGQRLQAVDVAHDPDDARKLERPAHHLRRTDANVNQQACWRLKTTGLETHHGGPATHIKMPFNAHSHLQIAGETSLSELRV